MSFFISDAVAQTAGPAAARARHGPPAAEPRRVALPQPLGRRGLGSLSPGKKDRVGGALGDHRDGEGLGRRGIALGRSSFTTAATAGAQQEGDQQRQQAC